MGLAITGVSSLVGAIILSVIVYDIIPYTDTPCDPAEPGCPDAYFSESYFHARQRFRSAARSSGAVLETILVYTDPVTGLGYTMDVAILAHATSSEAAETILVHSSGVHGVEGFAGSAIQIAALSRLSTGSGDDWRSGSVCTVFVHAVNPFGFASLRRFNENNVDLSRNNLSPAQWSMARARHPNHAGYADFDAALNLAHPPQWYVSVSAFVRVRARARVCECVPVPLRARVQV
jgi:hypothetical protein